MDKRVNRIDVVGKTVLLNKRSVSGNYVWEFYFIFSWKIYLKKIIPKELNMLNILPKKKLDIMEAENSWKCCKYVYTESQQRCLPRFSLDGNEVA